MKYAYKYRSSDNTCHEGVVSASSRDAAYDLLKAQGLKPFGVVEAPGFANKLFGKGKRWIAIFFLAAITVIVASQYVQTAKALKTTREFASVQERHQIYGDPAIMDELESSGFSAFAEKGDRILASFAQPGFVVAGLVVTDPEVLKGAVGGHVEFAAGDSRELRELKAIVNGMKDELRRYVEAGGTCADYLALLRERQSEELDFYAKISKELDGEKDDLVWEEKNAALRAMGLRTVPRRKKVVLKKVQNTPLTSE